MIEVRERANDLRYAIYDIVAGDITSSMTILNGMQSTKGHNHPHEEVYIFGSGVGTIEVGNQVSSVTSGTQVKITPNQYHRVFNCSPSPMVFTCVWELFESVAIAGYFDPFHEGHLDHIIKAAKIKPFLYIFVSSDDDAVAKKGRVHIPQVSRIEILQLIIRGLGVDGLVVPSIDTDGTQSLTLAHYKPSIFAKGGDRTMENMPRIELETCQQIKCRIEYGVGDLLNSSSAISRKLVNGKKARHTSFSYFNRLLTSLG